MKKAALVYQVFDKISEVQFQPNSKNTYTSEGEHLFELQFSEKSSQQDTIFSGSLGWIDSKRPSVGLKLRYLKIELNQQELKESYKIFQHGYQSWSFSTSYSGMEPDVSPLLGFLRYSEENIYTKHSARKGDFQAEGFTICYSTENHSGFLLGVNESGDQNVKVQVELNEVGRVLSLSLIYDFYNYPEFKSNTFLELTGCKLAKFASIQPELIMENYGKELAKKYGIKKTFSNVPTGWCSWYYYYTDINEKIILDNLRELRQKNLPVEFFQIDDGYQKEIGDWTTVNNKFPAGMQFLAEEIKRNNFRPGVWLAPFLVRKKSNFFQLYPEAVLKDENGNLVEAVWNPLWGWDHTYCIDVTHPAAISFLENVFTTFTKEYGFTYLKLDFLYSASLAGLTYNKKLTPYQRYRSTLELIRKIVGKNTFLLGCGAPLYPSIGIFDGMRIGCDVTPFWYPQMTRNWVRDKHALSTEKALINTLTRSFMHKNLWLNDPDCLLVRKEKNSMNYEQTIMMATIMAISGGILLVSDNLTTLEEDRWNILKKSFHLSNQCQAENSIPLGVFNYKFPRGFYNPAGILGLWNPEKQDSLIELDFPYSFDFKNLKDFWTGQRIETLSFDEVGKKLKIHLKAFQTVIFGVKD